MSEVRDTDAGSVPFEIVADYACEPGENPLWYEREQRLYWTDIPRGRRFRYNPKSEKHAMLRGSTGGWLHDPNGRSLILFMDGGTVTICHDGLPKEVIPEIAAERTLRFNDVIADPRGHSKSKVVCSIY